MTGRTDLRELWRELQAQWNRLDADPRVPHVLVGMVGGVGLVLVWGALRALWSAQWGRTLLGLLLGAGCLLLVWLHLTLTGGSRSADPNGSPEDRR
jgi:hypothetical protein